jgi:hypothetical protein
VGFDPTILAFLLAKAVHTFFFFFYGLPYQAPPFLSLSSAALFQFLTLISFFATSSTASIHLFLGFQREWDMETKIQ